MKFHPLGDRAVVVDFGEGKSGSKRAQHFSARLAAKALTGIEDIVTVYSRVAVFYDIVRFASEGNLPHDNVGRALRQAAKVRPTRSTRPARPRVVRIPVCFDVGLGPDLEAWAAHTGLSPAKALKLYCASKYIVAALGFAPGFPYLTGLPAKLAMPRRATPRTSVPAGSVGIGGEQTGIYPLASPGGWNLIGRTPMSLFDFSTTPGSRLRVGDRVQFRRITAAEFAAWK